MPFHRCPSGCGRFLSADDRHDSCLQCLGFQHAEDAFVDDSCACCGRMSTILLRSRLSFLKELAPSAATHLLPGESSVSFCFCSHFLKERAISFSSGFSGPWDDSVRRPASSLLPTTHFASSQDSTVRGRYSSPRTSGQSCLGPREFGEDASEHTAFCTIHPYSHSLHHHRYVDCAVGTTCTASGGVAHAAQPVSLAHAHNSTRLRDSVRQATSQVQRCSRDISGGPERPCLAQGDLAVLLAKDAIEPVSPPEMRQGFYSPYFIVPKKGGGLRPILDLRVLNRALHKLPF